MIFYNRVFDQKNNGLTIHTFIKDSADINPFSVEILSTHSASKIVDFIKEFDISCFHFFELKRKTDLQKYRFG